LASEDSGAAGYTLGLDPQPGVGIIDNTVKQWQTSRMKADLLLHERSQIEIDAFVEIRVWQVPRKVRGSKHLYKYSLAFVVAGSCILRYDNEAGKGDHKHKGQSEIPYLFTSPAQLVEDFWADVDQWRSQ